MAITLFVSINSRTDFATSSDKKISGFARPHGSKLFADSKISTLESGFKKVADSHANSPDTCGRKVKTERKVADSKISGYVWTGPKLLHRALQHLTDLLRRQFLCNWPQYIYMLWNKILNNPD